MDNEFENFVNGELPKRISTRDDPLKVVKGKIPVSTGVGLSTEFKNVEEVALQGKQGDNNYQLAVKNGFVGTEQQYLDSLKGKDGDNTEVLAAQRKAEDAAVMAVSARDSAVISSGIKNSVEEGLNSSKDGENFQVVSPESNEYVTLYKNVLGAAKWIDSYPNTEAINKKVNGIKGRNLFNIADQDIAVGFFPNNTTGSLQANVAYNCSGFIPVVGGRVYTASQKHYWVWYDYRKMFISGTSDGNQNKTQTAPAGAAFMRCSFGVGAKWLSGQVENGAMQTEFEPFLVGAFLDPLSVKDSVLSGRVLINESITREKTNFLKTGKNLFNKVSAAIGQFINHTNGVLVTDSTYDTSEKIKVIPGQQYTANTGMRFSCYFAVDGSVVPGGFSDYVSTFTVPAGAVYIQVTIPHTKLTVFQLEQGAVSTAFEVYGYKVEGPNGEKLVIESNTVIPDGAVTREKTNFLKTGKNLFNKTAALIAQFVNPINGVLTASPSYDTTEKIQIISGQQYVSNAKIRFSCYFGADGTTVISGGINDGGGLYNFTPPVNSVYVQVTFWHADLGMFQLEKGSQSTSFESFGWKIEGPNGEKLVGSESNATGASKWSGKTWGTLGDSITAGGLWQPGVVSNLGLKWTNFGIGGTRLSGPVGDLNAMCQDARINAIPTTTDLISSLSGTNDWAQNVPLGVIDSTDPLTFYGALNTQLSKLITRFPTKRISLFTTPYGEIYDFAKRGWPNSYTNTQGLTTLDYAEATRVACKRWGVPCIDIQGNVGWNTINIRTYINDDGALLHPNTLGGKRISETVVWGIKNIEPLE